jgi:hypothetical protein
MTLADRAINAIDEMLVTQVAQAASAAWARVAGGQDQASSIEQFIHALGELLALHEAMREAAVKKFGQ